MRSYFVVIFLLLYKVEQLFQVAVSSYGDVRLVLQYLASQCEAKRKRKAHVVYAQWDIKYHSLNARGSVCICV